MAYGTGSKDKSKPTKALIRLRAIRHQLYALLLSDIHLTIFNSQLTTVRLSHVLYAISYMLLFSTRYE
jgi:hypothetical protein